MIVDVVPAVKQAQVLQLGLVGFSRAERTEIERALLATETSAIVWRVGTLEASVAWCIHGARTQVLTDGSIRVAPGEAGGRSMRLSLEEIDRPVAFAEPVLCKDLEAAVTFLPTRIESVTSTLRTLESRWLGPTLARNWLCARLVACEPSLRHRVYHVLGDGELLAVIDRAGDVGLVPGVRLPDLERAHWVGLPSSSNFIPDHFHRLTWSELIWTYAIQSSSDHLPGRYRRKPIYFRRPPKVAQRLLRDQHLVLMAELRAGPSSFDALQAVTGFSADALSKALGELYLAGSVTVTPGRANDAHRFAPARHRCHEARGDRVWSASGDSRHSGSVIDTERLDRTVPAVFRFG